MPQPGSLVIRADPSNYVTDDEVQQLRAGGVDVVSIPGAEHSLWHSHYGEFMAALDGRDFEISFQPQKMLKRDDV